jgi:assimilatory nitrate reductase catalytic subunit
VALHPASALAAGIVEGELVRISSAYGEVLLPARLDEGQRRGEVFVPIHWNARFASHARIGSVLGARTDPWSGQPESKLEAVALQALPMRQWLLLLIRNELDAAMLEGMPALAYWERRPVAGGWCWRMALRDALDADAVAAIASAFAGSSALEFHDEAGFDRRVAFLDAAGVQGLLFAAARPQLLPAAEWAQNVLQREVPEDAWLLLAGRDLDAAPKGALICSCHEVGKDEIEQAIRGGCGDVAGLGKQLRCGTGCGSCIPELKALITQVQAEAGGAALALEVA